MNESTIQAWPIPCLQTDRNRE